MCLKPRSNLAARTVEEETLILDRASGQIHQLNSTASYIWSKFDGKTSTTEVIELVAKEFSVSSELAANDVAKLVEQFRTLNLLVSNPDNVEEENNNV